jgi:hypothetical protein
MFYVVKLTEYDSQILDIYHDEDDANDCMDNYYERYPYAYFDVLNDKELAAEPNLR